MFNSTDEQKSKYQSIINGVLNNYDSMIKRINGESLAYGKEFFGFTKGKITLTYIDDLKTKTKNNIIKIGQETFTKMVDELKQIKEDYFKECFPITETTDPLELDFVGKELAVMSYEEMADFYKSNFLDKNKVRLFDIEVKRRKISSEEKFNADAVMLENLREEYGLEDSITRQIDNNIKYFDSYRQMVSGMFTLIASIDGDMFNPKMIDYNKLFDFIESKSRWTIPQSINVNELLG